VVVSIFCEVYVMSQAATPSDIAVAHRLVSRDFRLMKHWDDGEATAILAPTMHNDESVAEPPTARQSGVPSARASNDWLHSAYGNVRWTIHRVIAEASELSHTPPCLAARTEPS
jgi:hypothetical protein